MTDNLPRMAKAQAGRKKKPLRRASVLGVQDAQTGIRFEMDTQRTRYWVVADKRRFVEALEDMGFRVCFTPEEREVLEAFRAYRQARDSQAEAEGTLAEVVREVNRARLALREAMIRGQDDDVGGYA